MIQFITHFDKTYAPQGFTMLESLNNHIDVRVGEEVRILALDENIFDRCHGGYLVDNVSFVSEVEDYLRRNGFDIDQIKATKTYREYCWLLEPAWVDYCLSRMPEIDDILVYCDADLFFFSDPAPGIFQAMENACVGLTPHYFPSGEEHREERVGCFNFGFGCFRVCDESKVIVRSWLEKSLEDCGETTAGHQRHLDSWPGELGAGFYRFGREWNAAPWQKQRLDRLPMCWHAHEFRRGGGRNPIMLKGEQWNRSNYELHPKTIENIYIPYERELVKWL